MFTSSSYSLPKAYYVYTSITIAIYNVTNIFGSCVNALIGATKDTFMGTETGVKNLT